MYFFFKKYTCIFFRILSYLGKSNVRIKLYMA
jgi:hypothetical protein